MFCLLSSLVRLSLEGQVRRLSAVWKFSPVFMEGFAESSVLSLGILKKMDCWSDERLFAPFFVE